MGKGDRTMNDKEELETLANLFIIDHKKLSLLEKEKYDHIQYIEEQLRILEIHRRRLLRVWKAISESLMDREQ